MGEFPVSNVVDKADQVKCTSDDELLEPFVKDVGA